jgi:hypothetical protein
MLLQNLIDTNLITWQNLHYSKGLYDHQVPRSKNSEFFLKSLKRAWFKIKNIATLGHFLASFYDLRD